MQITPSSNPAVEAVVGYAADRRGNGVAYARLMGSRSRRLLRIGFRVTTQAPCSDQATGYAALTALARALRKRGVREVRFVLGDPQFVEAITTGRGVGETLALPYVRLRCVLNSFAKFGVQAGATDDFTHRAQAEVALNLAA